MNSPRNPLEPVGPGQHEGLEVGPASEREVDQNIAATRHAIRQLLIFVGGTGLETAFKLGQILRAHGITFGDESQAAHRPLIPHAIVVDTHVDAARSALGRNGRDRGEGVEEDASEKRWQMQVDELKGMGVNVCVLFDKGTEDFLIQRNLLPSLTSDIPTKADPMGARTDPRYGWVRYLVAREKEDDKNNPRTVIRRVIDSWLKRGNAFLDNQTFLTVVGGLHGGTGQISLPLMADARHDIEHALRGNDTTLVTERYAMTAESAEYDEARRQDGYQRKRVLNTASGAVLANAADAQKGVSMLPGEFVQGIPSEFTFIIGGSNPHRRVGEHYEPTACVAKQLAARILGLDLTGTGRSNADFSDRVLGVPNEEVPNTPKAVFSTLGVSEVRTYPDRADLTAQKRRLLLDAVLGLSRVNDAAVEEKVDILLPRNLLDEKLNDAQAPQISSGHFGEGEDAKRYARSARDDFMGQLRAALPAEIKRSLHDWRQEMIDRITAATEELKQQNGLKTALAFLQILSEGLDVLSRTAENSLSRDCSDDTIDSFKEQGEELLRRIERFKIPLFNLFGSRKKALDDLQRLTDKLAERYNHIAVLTRNNVYFRNLDRSCLASIKETIGRLRDVFMREFSEGEAVLGAIEADPRERSLETPFDVEVPVRFSLRETPLTLRADYFGGDGEWTRDMMQKFVASIRVDARDMDLVGKLTGEVVAAVAKLAQPLSRSSTLATDKNYSNRGGTVSIPVQTRQEAQGIPHPESFSPFPVGPEGPYILVEEQYGVDVLLDDAYVRKCLEELLATPPTRERAVLLAGANLHEPELKKKLNREGQFPFRGQAEKLLPPVFLALAERKFQEAGRKGEIVKSCPGKDCGVPFYISEAEKLAKVTCCPACRRIP